MIGLSIGIVSGLLQFWLLTKFVKGITSGSVDIIYMSMGIVQFLLPAAVLVGVAFLRRQDLLLAGTGMAGVLIIGAILKYVVFARKSRGRGNNND